MALKYHCPKCEKKFVDWGAEKLGFKCPDCKGEELVRGGQESETVELKRAPSLKRQPALAARGGDETEAPFAGTEDVDTEGEDLEGDDISDLDDEDIEIGDDDADETVIVDDED